MENFDSKGAKIKCHDKSVHSKENYKHAGKNQNKALRTCQLVRECILASETISSPLGTSKWKLHLIFNIFRMWSDCFNVTQLNGYIS